MQRSYAPGRVTPNVLLIFAALGLALTGCPEDLDSDGYTVEEGDCDDGDPTVNPGAEEVEDGIDNDCDGLIDEDMSSPTPSASGSPSPTEGDLDGDGYTVAEGDCAEGRPDIYPGAEELCDGRDNDCDESVDEGDFDEDGDGYLLCGASGAPPDCDDSDEEIYPGAEERCDTADNDCDGYVDESFDQDGDGVSSCGGDCDDDAAETAPGNLERCDGEDNDCDAAVDEGLDQDLDQDGHYHPSACATPNDDCDDGDPDRYPGHPEVCDGEDDDCDGLVDDGVLNACGQCGTLPTETCNGRDDDCDGDTDEGVLNACGSCGSAPTETCNFSDEDCDGRIDEGVQNACGSCGTVPTEVCDGSDNDCDGQADEGLLNACGACGSAPAERCDGLDNDCDGRTDEGVQNACGGCGAVPTESCDGRDNDCDGRTDEGVTTLYYKDRDDDTYGLCSTYRYACGAGGDYTAMRCGDCDDSYAFIQPGVSSHTLVSLYHEGAQDHLTTIEGSSDYQNALSLGYRHADPYKIGWSLTARPGDSDYWVKLVRAYNASRSDHCTLTANQDPQSACGSGYNVEDLNLGWLRTADAESYTLHFQRMYRADRTNHRQSKNPSTTEELKGKGYTEAGHAGWVFSSPVSCP